MTFQTRTIALLAVASVTSLLAGGCDEDISYRGGLHTGYDSDDFYFGGWDDDDDWDRGGVIIHRKTPVIRHYDRVIVTPPVGRRRVIVPPVVGHRRRCPPVVGRGRRHPSRKDCDRPSRTGRHPRRRYPRRARVHPRRPAGYPPNVVHPGQSPWGYRSRSGRCD